MTGNLVEELEAGHRGDESPAILLPRLTLTRAQLWQDVAARRTELSKAGVGPGSTVAVQVPPSVTYINVVLAILQLDARPLLLHHSVSDAERAAALGPFVLAADVRAPSAARLSRFQPTAELLITPGTAADRDGPGLAVVQFTSGSTGQPKAVQRSEKSIRAELHAVRQHAGWIREGDVVLTLNSLVHSFGLFGAVLYAQQVGAVLAFPATAQPSDLGAAIAEHRPAAITGVPAHFELLTVLEPGTLRGVRCCVSGGQLIKPAAHAAFVNRHGVPLGQAYGLTELGLVAADFAGSLTPSVGHLSAGSEVVIVDDEVVVRCPESPYLTPDEGRHWRNGWFHTHDRGRLDGDVLTVQGRMDSVVAVGGLKLDLGEVEQAIADCPAVSGVVVLFADDVVRAVVESRELSAADIHRWCEQRLSAHKRPRFVEIVSQLPRTPSGKLVRDPARLRNGGRK